MNGAEVIRDPLGLNLLLFSVGGIHFGVDAEQVEETRAFAGDDNGLAWFHREMGYGREVPYREPAVLTIRTGADAEYRVVIDTMEEVIGITADEITPLPPLVEPWALRNGLWGIVAEADRMILLLDFFRFLKNKKAVSIL